MLKLDFISAAPNLSIFKAGSNKTNLGGVLFLIYVILFILFAIIYLYDYFTKETYSYNYTFVKNNTNLPEEAKLMNEKEFDFYFTLIKGVSSGVTNLSNNFLIIDIESLYQKKDEPNPEDGFYYINTSETSNEKCIIKQYSKYQRRLKDFRLAVLYRCNGTNENDCTIRKDDKIEIDSYRLHSGFRGYLFDHQNPDNPLPILEENKYFFQDIQFLENTNIIYLNWKLIEYEETQSAFSKYILILVIKKNLIGEEK
jgi:hypothetical protein